jgi:hypothetical protein
MWKNIFIESCLLSALVFGGFYIHSNVLKDEISVSDESIKELSARQKLTHVSGNASSPPTTSQHHLSGSSSKTPLGHLSDMTQKLPTAQP